MLVLAFWGDAGQLGEPEFHCGGEGSIEQANQRKPLVLHSALKLESADPVHWWAKSRPSLVDELQG